MEHMNKDPYIFYGRPSFREYHHTDMSQGLKWHHVARMRTGTARIETLAGERLHLRAGDVFYLPMGLCYHSYWYGDDKDVERRVEWDTLGFTYFPDFSGRHYAPQLLHTDAECMTILEHLFDMPFDTVSGSGWLYLLLGRVLPDMIEIKPNAKQDMIARAKQYMLDHPSDSVEQLAMHCGMSPSSLYSLFRDHSDVSIREFKVQVRIDRAIELLTTTDLSVEEISRRLDFSSAAYFRAVFKQMTGCSPSEQRHREAIMKIL